MYIATGTEYDVLFDPKNKMVTVTEWEMYQEEVCDYDGVCYYKEVKGLDYDSPILVGEDWLDEAYYSGVSLKMFEDP